MTVIAAIDDQRIVMDGFGFDTLLKLPVIESSPTSLTLDYDGYVDHFTGTGVYYDSNDRPISGTITGFEQTHDGKVLFSLSGLNIDAVKFYDALLHGTGYRYGEEIGLLLPGDDTLTGSSHADRIMMGEGNNVAYGGDGADWITAGNGNDHLYGQSPNGGPDGGDMIIARGGSDYVQGNAGNDSISGGRGSDRIYGGAGNDSLRGENGNDSINGNLGNDTIDGGNDDDTIRGGQGDDLLIGNLGSDLLMGDLGNDILIAKASSQGSWPGRDTLIGGAGADLFQFFTEMSPTTGKDANGVPLDLTTINDFTVGEDKIGIKGFNNNPDSPGFVYAEADNPGAAVSFAATQTYNIFHSQLVIVGVGSDSYVFFGGEAAPHFGEAILLKGVAAHDLTIASFTTGINEPTFYYADDGFFV